MSYHSTITTKDYSKKKGEEHNAVRNDFNATLKMAQKSRSRDEPNKEDAVKKTREEIVRKDRYLQYTIAYLEETEGKFSSFHIHNIKEAANKLEDYYLSQFASVYNLKISTKTN